MERTINVTFPGGKRVDAEIKGEVIHTDQSVKNGGDGSHPEPFTLFLASIATCAGIYALEFCANRSIASQGLNVQLKMTFDPEKKRYSNMRIEIHVPEEFPEKYRKAIIRAVDLCAVKKHMMTPPDFETIVV